MPRAAKDPFEAGLKRYFVKEYERCGSFSQHKVCIVHPQAADAMIGAPSAEHEPFGFGGFGLGGLSAQGPAPDGTRSVHKHSQLPGDLVVTLPGSYHSGFSTQMNYGEATNYATEHWLASFETPPISLCYLHNESTLTFQAAKWKTMQRQLCSVAPKF